MLHSGRSLPIPVSEAAEPRQVLVVDDSKAQRRVLSLSLERWGYRVTEAGSAEEALRLCAGQTFDIVLSDWVMPGMSGLEFCKAFRALPNDRYGYFVLLTSKSEKGEIADGLDGGADDFLIKPVNSDELHARLRAGERLIGMQRELVEKNRLIGATLDELQKVYDSLDRDLIEARKLQQTLVRERHRQFTGGTATILLRPSGHVGGDLAGFFDISARRVALYSVDVSGHGVASAMMTARLAGMLSGTTPDQNVALTGGVDGNRGAWPPEMVAWRLNRLMLDDLQVEQYFTMAYAEIDLLTGKVMLVQAGHPHPLLIRASGEVEQLGNGGMPIGLLPNIAFERIETTLQVGDRLFLVSDGVTECPDPAGNELGAEGLIEFLQKNPDLSPEDLFEALVWHLNVHAAGVDFPDDVSGVLFDYSG